MYFGPENVETRMRRGTKYKLHSIAYGKFIAFGFCAILLTWRTRTYHCTMQRPFYNNLLIEWSAKCGKCFFFFVRSFVCRNLELERVSCSFKWQRLDSLRFFFSFALFRNVVELNPHQNQIRGKSGKKLKRKKNKTQLKMFQIVFFKHSFVTRWYVTNGGNAGFTLCENKRIAKELDLFGRTGDDSDLFRIRCVRCAVNCARSTVNDICSESSSSHDAHVK